MITPGPLVAFDLQDDTVPRRVYVPQNLPTRRILKPVPEEPNSYYFTVDNSSLEYFTKCARAAEYYLVRSREPNRSAAALVFGGALHKAVEITLKHGVNEATIQKGVGAIYTHFETLPPAVEEWRTPDLAVEVFKKYCAKYPYELFSVARSETGEPLVEIGFAIPLGSVKLGTRVKYTAQQLVVLGNVDEACGWQPDSTAEGLLIDKIYILWSGRMDAILEWDGMFWVMDHKTTSIAGPGFYNDFILSMQTVGYTWAASKITGHRVAGLVLNALVTRKPTKTGKAIEFERRRYPYSDDLLDEWEQDVMEIITQFFSRLQSGHFPKETAWCEAKYGQCKYHEVCTLPRAQRNVMLQGNLFRDVTWNPLHINDE